MTKVYIALFTCATSQAVHLELVSSLEAKKKLKTNCFRQRDNLSGLREDLS